MLFLLSLLIILMVQLVLLPHIFPQWHAGSGLLIGGDWVSFHREAVLVAERIEVEGWSAWELRPKGWLPAGIASAFYALFLPQPWVLAPLNAVIHATTGLVVLKIMLFFTREQNVAAVAVLPYLFFPSALLIFSQVHRDSFYILGTVLYMYALLDIFKKEITRSGLWKHLLVTLLVALGGVVLIWMARPYALIIFFYVSLPFLFGLIVYHLILLLGGRANWITAVSRVALLIAILAVLFGFPESDDTDKYLVDIGIIEEQLNNGSVSMEKKDNEQYISEIDTINWGVQWQSTDLLPEQVEQLFKSVAVLRAKYLFRYDHAESSIDDEAVFNQVADFIFYLPRALQIIYLSPFPQDWFTEGRGEETTYFRRIVGMEMVVIYLLYFSILCGWWRWRRKIEFYVLTIFCTGMMLPFAYAVPNLGTIHRYRYGFLMLLVGLGVVALLNILEARYNWKIKLFNWISKGEEEGYE